MSGEPGVQRPKRAPTRCAMIQPYVDVGTVTLLEHRAVVLRCHRDQLAAFIVECVMRDENLQRALKIHAVG